MKTLPSGVTDRPENTQPEIDQNFDPEITDQEQILELENNPLHLQIPASPRPSTSTAEETSRGNTSPSLLEFIGSTEYSASLPMPIYTTPEKSVLNDLSDLAGQPEAIIPTAATECDLIERPKVMPIITPISFGSRSKPLLEVGKGSQEN